MGLLDSDSFRRKSAILAALVESVSSIQGVEWSGVSVSQQGRAAELTRPIRFRSGQKRRGRAQYKKEDACLLGCMGRRFPHRENAHCSPALVQKLHNPVCPPHVPNSSRVTTSSPEPKVSAWERYNLCVGPLRGCLSLPQPSIPHEWSESPVFHRQMPWGTLFLEPVLWAREAGAGTGSPAPPGGTSMDEMSLQFSTTTWRFGVSVSCLHPPTSLNVAFSL